MGCVYEYTRPGHVVDNTSASVLTAASRLNRRRTKICDGRGSKSSREGRPSPGDGHVQGTRRRRPTRRQNPRVEKCTYDDERATPSVRRALIYDYCLARAQQTRRIRGLGRRYRRDNVPLVVRT